MSRSVITEINAEEVFDLIKSDVNSSALEYFDRYMQIATKLWVGYIDDKFACVWGLIPLSLISNNGYLWLHATEAIRGNEFLFIRRSKIVVEDLLHIWPALHGHVLIGQSQSIKWLRMLGAKFGEPSGKLIPFVIRGSHG